MLPSNVLMSRTPPGTILMVTEAAFYPPYRGDSRRLFTLITNLRARGWRVCVAHLHDRAQPDVDYEAMARLCDGLSIYYPSDADLARRSWREMDSYCPPGLVELTEQMARRLRPQVLLTQFVFLSRCLDIDTGRDRPVKVIDADNRFSGRARAYREKGLPYDWFSTDEEQERRGLLRADLILAIQEREAEYYSHLLPENRRVMLLPHLESVRYHPPPAGETLLFVGASNAENAAGISRFLDEAFPLIRRRHPGARLIIAGRVCELIPSSCAGVEFVHLVDDLTALYAKAAIVLNPTIVGSGIKIKTVEALCNGRCLVATRHGIQGLENYPDIYCRADTPEEFATAIISLLDEPRRISELGTRAQRFAAAYFDPATSLKRLEAALSREMLAFSGGRL